MKVLDLRNGPVLRVALRAIVVLSVFVPAPRIAAQGAQDYVIGPKDVLDIKVAEVPELNVERRVQDNGTIDLPLLGQVPVSGTTAMELRDRLTALLTAKYVNQAYVTVTIKEYANKPIVILGAVGKAGILAVTGRWSLQQALLQAGGLAQGAGKRISILRTAENGLSERLDVNADDLFVRLSPVWNVPIFPGDIVNVGVKQEITVYLLGEFKASGAQKLSSDETPTLLLLIAKVGGLTDKAAKGSLSVKRKEPDGRLRAFNVSYSRILSGKDPDFVLKDGDVIVAKESLF